MHKIILMGACLLAAGCTTLPQDGSGKITGFFDDPWHIKPRNGIEVAHLHTVFTREHPSECPKELMACASTHDGTITLRSKMPASFGDDDVICDMGAAFLRELGMAVPTPAHYRTRGPRLNFSAGPHLNKISVRIHWGNTQPCQDGMFACAQVGQGNEQLYNLYFPHMRSTAQSWHVCTMGHELLHTLGATHPAREEEIFPVQEWLAKVKAGLTTTRHNTDGNVD